MTGVHPVADEWTEEYVVYVSSASRVLLTDPFTSFLEYATAERLRPVLVTGADAVVSSFVSLAMRRAGGHWAVRDGEGRVFDALSGYRVFQFADLWERADTDRERLASFSRRRQPHGVLTFDVFAHQRAAAETVVGGLAPAVTAALGGTELDVWGLTEPLTDVWSTAAVTETARRAMPQSPVMHARGRNGTFVDISVARTKRGILEQVKGGVPVGTYEHRTAQLIDRASATLTMVAEQFRPTIGFVSVAEFDVGTVQGASGKRPEVPLAALIGPRGVHDLEIDIDALSREHDVTLLGRRRIPSLLVRFSARDKGMWAQLLAFAWDLGLEKVAAAAGLEEMI